MLTISTASKYIKYLVVAAVLLPLIFIAEVTYVEEQHTKAISQVQTKEFSQRKAEVEDAWLSSQAAYVRGIAKLTAVTVGEQEAMNNEFHAFLTADFKSLGYAGNDGEIKTDTSGSRGRDITGRNYFTEAVAGREFTGRVSGADWLLDEEVTVVAVPVAANGEVIGVVYGVISQETIAAMLAKVVPAISGQQQTIAHWLVWLGGVYFLGVIPLLLLVFLLRRHKLAVGATATAVNKRPAVSKKRSITTEDNAFTNRQRPIATVDEGPTTVKKAFIDATTAETPEAIAIRKIAEINAAETADTTPAVVIDRVLAAAAYKGIGTTKKTPSIPDEPVQIAVIEPEHTASPLQETKADLATMDALTGLYTRAAFEKRIAAQQGQPDSVIVVLSIDGMKVINDFLGNPAGDTIITVTANILKIVAGPSCTTARIDGDRFVALLTAVSPDMLADIKNDIKYYIDLHNLRQPELPLSITTGVAAARQGESLTAVWERANRDMESRKAVNRVEARKFIMVSIKRQRQKL